MIYGHMVRLAMDDYHADVVQHLDFERMLNEWTIIYGILEMDEFWEEHFSSWFHTLMGFIGIFTCLV